ncbi:30S ribosomal protein S15 [Candidatus Phytoplasma luffae]|uniref:30S ribosomal protein S15 n=1 Tax=Loofah witches'-broom phytoplasma TaxID=35773 RepID=A0A975FJ02_LOWBP|nr:30S ribosomal protein S15 [Candidatus Phytoplasma luffae]QTX02829.1 30S ribosomal protein S15 [Candidatus Phytoplasma luffae]
MILTKEQKKQIIKENTDNENNTGCVKVQIALLSRGIEELNKHLKEHPKDFDSKRSLLIKNKRKNILMRYLSQNK